MPGTAPVQKVGNFDVERAPGYVLLRSTQSINPVFCEKLVHTVDGLLEEIPANEYAFFALEVSLDTTGAAHFVRAAAQIRKKLKALQKEFVIIGPHHEWVHFLSSQGLDIRVVADIFELISLVPSAYSPLQKEKIAPGAKSPKSAKRVPQADVNFINPFIDATLKTLKIQCSVDASAGKPAKKGSGPALSVDIAGVIGLKGKGFCGAIALSFPKATFLSLMGQMLGEKYDQITDELQNGAGELLNIIFGQAKATLNQSGLSIQQAIPHVLVGANVNPCPVSPYPTIVLPFNSGSGQFQIEISIDDDDV